MDMVPETAAGRRFHGLWTSAIASSPQQNPRRHLLSSTTVMLPPQPLFRRRRLEFLRRRLCLLLSLCRHLRLQPHHRSPAVASSLWPVALESLVSSSEFVSVFKLLVLKLEFSSCLVPTLWSLLVSFPPLRSDTLEFSWALTHPSFKVSSLSRHLISAGVFDPIGYSVLPSMRFVTAICRDLLRHRFLQLLSDRPPILSIESGFIARPYILEVLAVAHSSSNQLADDFTQGVWSLLVAFLPTPPVPPDPPDCVILSHCYIVSWISGTTVLILSWLEDMCMMIVCASTTSSLPSKQGLVLLVQWFGWLLTSLGSIVRIFLLRHKLLSTNLSLYEDARLVLSSLLPLYEDVTLPLYEDLDTLPFYEDFVTLPLYEDLDILPLYEELITLSLYENLDTFPLYEDYVTLPLCEDLGSFVEFFTPCIHHLFQMIVLQGVSSQAHLLGV